MALDRLDELLADAVAEATARERASTRMLLQAAEQEATLAGALVDVMERAEVVTARMASGRSYRGRVRAVGRDFVILREAGHPPALLSLGALGSVRVVTPSREPGGARSGPEAASLRVVLAGLAPERPRVQVGCIGEDALLVGELRTVGIDVLTLRLDAAARPTVLVPVAALAEAVVLEI